MVLCCANLVFTEAGNAIDRFVREKAEEKGLGCSPEADRLSLLRRVSFDLTGLPLDMGLFEASADDRDSASIDDVIEALLNSPQFGERMASMWMNVARYAEDQAHQVGNDVKHFYSNAYLYREWVVDAFNADLPYDWFVKLQLAADLYGSTSESDLPALGFLGLGPKYYNRGRLDVRADEWEDRVDTVMRGFLGLTVACARCHDHKFDPIPTEDYYALAGVFASTKMVNAPYGKQPDELTEEEKKQGLYTVHIVEEGEPQDLPVFIRGNVERKGSVVPRRFLSLFYGKGQGPRRFTEGSGRRELAEAIASPENPLTAKVYVNRIWQEFFGRGIVGTPSNFGALGEEPSHPELLDYLAEQFVQHGWSTKWLVRLIVSANTYRQASDVVDAYAEIDPENRYLWRMPRRRLSVEMWRDSLLTFAGNMDQGRGRSLKLDDPSNHRRTLYGRVSRKRLNPLLMLHDYPDPNVHSAKRTVTTTPLQKLYSLNSEFVLEQARGLAKRLRDQTSSDEDWIERAYRLLFLRVPSGEEVSLGLRFLGSGKMEAEKRQTLYAQALLMSNEISYLD
ncbi:MAG: hypothetical protein M2R45_00360 [Verrucomicrobia subdivision 3 bacterium]|nr:hypothetical protein [Limisphaerales bacterium]MCS1412882.1 hypothetical protein [Limisphaerales bacterium]